MIRGGILFLLIRAKKKSNKTIFILRQSTKCNKIHRHYNNSRQDIKAMDKLQSVWWGY